MNRKIATTLIILFCLTFFSVLIYSKFTTKDTLDEEFNGIVSEIRRMYPSKIVVKLLNQSETFYMVNEREEFINSVNIGDSISKPINDKYIYIYKLKNNKFIAS